MDFLSALFKGIGDTFTAGANVNLGQMHERESYLNSKLKRDELDSETQMAKFDFLNQNAKNNFNLIVLIVAAIVVMIAIGIIFKK